MKENKNIQVHIVGAGPGDPELLTVKALIAIQNAKAILYDALVNPEILHHANPDAILIPVGKRAGQPSMKQEEINLKLVQSAFKYKNVVRLKGGDPFIFGRGHEELDYLRAFDIEVALVPGISSSTSLAMLQQVPLTRRHISESFWVMTGTTKDLNLSDDVKLAAKSTATAVILMGTRKIKEIADHFITHGKANTPAMVIFNGSNEDEKVILGHVFDIAEKLDKGRVPGPGIIVIGEVVGLHPEYVSSYISQEYRA